MQNIAIKRKKTTIFQKNINKIAFYPMTSNLISFKASFSNLETCA